MSKNVFSALQEDLKPKKESPAPAPAVPIGQIGRFAPSTSSWGDDEDEVAPAPAPQPVQQVESDHESEEESEEESSSSGPRPAAQPKKKEPVKQVSKKEKKQLEDEDFEKVMAEFGVKAEVKESAESESKKKKKNKKEKKETTEEEKKEEKKEEQKEEESSAAPVDREAALAALKAKMGGQKKSKAGEKAVNAALAEVQSRKKKEKRLPINDVYGR